jgi:hypothetical protein
MKTTNENKKNECAHGRASGGSRLQLQIYVNQFTDELNEAVLEALPSLAQKKGKLKWVSPLATEDYAEYRDEEFLKKLGCGENAKRLKEFWPKRGPCWDALARLEVEGSTDCRGVVLVEAKSHRIEIFGNGCGAKDDRLELIEKSLKDTRDWLGVSKDITWQWTGPLYQYANRLAHLYFLPEILSLPVWLVNIYFIYDPDRPTRYSAWEEFLPEVKEELGLTNIDIPDMANVFLDAKDPHKP